MSESNVLEKFLETAVDANARYCSLLGEWAGCLVDTLLTSSTGLRSEFEVERNAGAGTDAGAESSQALARVGKPVTPKSAVAPTMILEGPAGGRAIGFFIIENKLQKKMTMRVEFAPLVDPAGEKVKSGLVFQPGKVTLGPGQQVIAKVTARISPVLAVGVRYRGEIRIPKMAGARIPIVVVRTTSAPPASRARARNSESTSIFRYQKRNLRTPSTGAPRERTPRHPKS